MTEQRVERHALALALFAGLTWSSVAAADEEREPPPAPPPASASSGRMQIDVPPPPPPSPPVGARKHEGFYLRLSGGIAGIIQDRSTDGPTTVSIGQSGTMLQPAGAFELSVGGAPWLGTNLALTALGHYTGNTDVHTSTGPNLQLSGYWMGIVGVSFDHYPKPREGLHFSGTVGPAFYGASVRAGQEDLVDISSVGGGGIGLSAAFGNDWWVGPMTSLGIQARMTYAWMKGTHKVGVEPAGSTVELSEYNNTGIVGVYLTFVYQ